jgi:hypothetical protein
VRSYQNSGDASGSIHVIDRRLSEFGVHADSLVGSRRGFLSVALLLA